MSRSRDVSAVQNNLGVAIPPAAAGKNAVINGGFDIWQRGTSFPSNASAYIYTADRWNWVRSGGALGGTVSRQTSGLTGFQYCARIQRDSGNTSTAQTFLQYAAETADSLKFAGQTITVSFYARAGANYSSTSNVLTATCNYGTGTDQPMQSFTGAATVVSSNVTLTTSWQRFTMSGSVSSTATEIGVYFSNAPTGTAGANDYFEITGVQLELGSSATPFSRAGGTIQGELAACQRYYTRFIADNAYTYFAIGSAQNTNTLFATAQMPVPLRTGPTSLDLPALTNFFCEQSSSVFVTGLTAISMGTASRYTLMIQIDKTAGFVAGAFYRLLANNSTSAYIGVNAEL